MNSGTTSLHYFIDEFISFTLIDQKRIDKKEKKEKEDEEERHKMTYRYVKYSLGLKHQVGIACKT